MHKAFPRFSPHQVPTLALAHAEILSLQLVQKILKAETHSNTVRTICEKWMRLSSTVYLVTSPWVTIKFKT